MSTDPDVDKANMLIAAYESYRSPAAWAADMAQLCPDGNNGQQSTEGWVYRTEFPDRGWTLYLQLLDGPSAERPDVPVVWDYTAIHHDHHTEIVRGHAIPGGTVRSHADQARLILALVATDESPCEHPDTSSSRSDHTSTERQAPVRPADPRTDDLTDTQQVRAEQIHPGDLIVADRPGGIHAVANVDHPALLDGGVLVRFHCLGSVVIAAYPGDMITIVPRPRPRAGASAEDHG